MANFGGKNRIELESQILCAALRQSWADTDATGMVKSCQELSTIFPDLLPPPSPQVTNPNNYYDVLEIDCDVNTPKIIAAYFKAVKKFLRENPKPRNMRNEYYTLLNAGFILRRPRSRLSHDLIVVRGALLDSNVIPEDGTLTIVATPTVVQPAVEPAPHVEEVVAPVVALEEEIIAPEVPDAPAEVAGEIDVAAEVAAEPETELVAETEVEAVAETVVEPIVESIAAPVEQPKEALPVLIELLQYADFIGPAEILALQNQTERFPDIELVDLILHSGYVPIPEMKALLLAEAIINSGKMTLPQMRAILSEKRPWLDIYYPFKGM